MTAAETVKWVRAQEGVHEDPMGSNRIRYWDEIDLSGLNGSEWCGGLAYLAMQHGNADLSWTTARRFVYTPAGIADARSAGIFYTGNPRIGDPVWFNFDSDSDPEHVGIVVGASTDGVHISTVEGNVRDRVSSMSRPFSQIIGYARVNYKESDMDLDDQIKYAGFTRDSWEDFQGSPIRGGTVGQTLQWALGAALRAAAEAREAVEAVKQVTTPPAPDVDYDQLAAALIAGGLTVDPGALAVAVADELAGRLKE